MGKLIKLVPNNSLPLISKYDDYIESIERESILTSEEERELSTRIQNGDQEALKLLVKANLRFVVTIAKQYAEKGKELGIELPDLINEGNLGLIKSAQRFDASKDFKFMSYAIWWIRQSILSSLSEKV